tara:strand:+ start:1953 stop:2663 length:711 start_codon:yes stop_codon:yes gene_type:complete
MAKQIKWIQVDAATQVSVNIAKPSEGAANPNLTDLVEQFDYGQWRYGTCADSVTINSASNDNNIFEISDADYIAEIKAKIEQYVREWKVSAYEQEKNLRNTQLSDYSDSVYASASGYKYNAATAFLSSATANAGLTTEATVRGISVTALANKIKTNHEAYITKDAQISGLRGLLYDRIASIGINSTSVATALASYVGIHTNETVTNVGLGITHEVGFYNPSGLEGRFKVEAGIIEE